MNKKIYIGNSLLKNIEKKITGEFLEINKQKFYKISNYDEMPPFFISIVSAYEHWMYVSSNGSLTAGRKDKDNALFPYYTVDKIHNFKGITGSKTIIFATDEENTYLWEPFSNSFKFLYNIEQNIYKNLPGNILIFEEINKDLNLTFRYKLSTADKLGFIKESELANNNNNSVKINILDGIQNILPSGTNSTFQLNFSNLLDAYKKNELIDSKIGIYYLSSIPTDRAEPSEGLLATVVWSYGFDDFKVLLSSKQLESFRKTAFVNHEEDIRAKRGAYFVNSEFELASKSTKSWYIIADINLDIPQIEEIKNFLNKKSNLAEFIKKNIEDNTEKLLKKISYADGLQATADSASISRHISNVLFNIMRGGIFDDRNGIETGNYRCHIERSNACVYNKEQEFLNSLPDYIQYEDLLKKVSSKNNPDLMRLTYEYLPLVFSRRHGDPSRPWNQFSIKLKDENGKNIFGYEGNWRDIFQNWEALAMSFPKYIESIIVKFVNASTVDGYNPYRISEQGIDWEVVEPDNPWSNIGYWGDHQIIYLQKLLELSQKYNPENLHSLLNKNIFCFANVPYRIKSYEEIVHNPNDTIIFDKNLQAEILTRTEKLGSDGKLVHNTDNEIFKITLYEKLILTLLTKLSNFIPEAGIWLNTQRPEWNDANNALVGQGTSMVTLYYIRRYAKFILKLFQNEKNKEIVLTKELNQFFFEINNTLKENIKILENSFTDQQRKQFTDSVGQAGSTYRKLVYGKHSGIRVSVSTEKIKNFLELTLSFIEHSIKANKREDKLYHSYNLIKFDLKENKIIIKHLYEMLEGQVAVLSSGYLSISESIEVLDALKNSKMFREDQYSYMLYPNRKLPKFIEKNNIPTEYSNNSQLFKTLEKENDKSLIVKDRNNVFHFNKKFRNIQDVKVALEKLENKGYGKLVEKEQEAIYNLWEKMFNHSEFTGRSGTFFGYEGLGSIYWHMVSKLLLSVAELYYSAIEIKANKNELSRIIEHYYEIRAGIGLNKSPKVYGAFPTDPYSHTPEDGGAKQPGMTGQVKEDIISRFYELGICVKEGLLEFKPELLRKSEFLQNSHTFVYFSNSGTKNEIKLKPEELAFTYCGIPIVYQISDNQYVELIYKNKKIVFEYLILDRETSQLVFNRDKNIKRINVFLTPKLS